MRLGQDEAKGEGVASKKRQDENVKKKEGDNDADGNETPFIVGKPCKELKPYILTRMPPEKAILKGKVKLSPWKVSKRCWVAENWAWKTFQYIPGISGPPDLPQDGIKIAVRVDTYGWRPMPMSFKGSIPTIEDPATISVLVPPGKVCYFFTVDGEPNFSSDQYTCCVDENDSRKSSHLHSEDYWFKLAKKENKNTSSFGAGGSWPDNMLPVVNFIEPKLDVRTR